MKAGFIRRILQEDQVLTTLTQAAATVSSGDAPVGADPDSMSSEALLTAITTALTEDKAEDMVEIDLRGKSSIGDYMVICSGRSSRQVTSMAEKLAEKLKQDYGRTSRIEGKGAGDWVLIDTGDVIVHIFRPEVRDFYQLEKMWMPPARTAGAG